MFLIKWTVNPLTKTAAESFVKTVGRQEIKAKVSNQIKGKKITFKQIFKNSI